MRHICWALFSLALSAFSCKKTTPDFVIPEGNYIGTFQRSNSGGGQISNVSITFSANNWTGQSQYEKYPALCHGTYKASGSDNITFENACPWTAEFDGTLILSKEYKLKVVGNSIEISRDYNGAYKDIYKLTKQ